MSTGFNSSFSLNKPLHMFQNQQSSCSNKKSGFRPIKESKGATTRVRAHVAHTMLLQVDVPPPSLSRDKPCLDRCLRSRYLPTQIPFSALPCAAYLSAQDVKEIADVFRSFSVLPDALRFNANRHNGANSNPFQREHLVDSSMPVNDRDLTKNAQTTESSGHLEQRSVCAPVQSGSKSSMSAENLGMERPLKGTLPDDLAISKEWLVELLLAVMARNYSQEQMKHISPGRNYNVSSNSATLGFSLHQSGKFDPVGMDSLQGTIPFLPIGVLPVGVIPGDNSPFGLTASKDITASIVLHKMRRFQQKQAVLTQFKRDLLRWIEPLLLVLDPDHNSGMNERCKDQIDKLHFFHQLMRSRRTQMDESVGLFSTTSAMPHATLACKRVLVKSKKQESEDGRGSTKTLASTRTSDPITVGACQSHIPLSETPLSHELILRRPSVDVSLSGHFSSRSSSSRRSSVSTLEGYVYSSKSSISGPHKGINITGSGCAMKDTGGHGNSAPGELALACQGNDFSVSRIVKELNVPIFVRDDDCIESESSAFLIYYGEQPDGAISQTFKDILTNSKLWEQFLLEWERRTELVSTLSESTNCSLNGVPLRRNNNRQRAVVSWRDFSNNLILPADCLPSSTVVPTNVSPTDIKNCNVHANDLSSRYVCNDSTNSRARGEAVYKRVLKVRLEGGAKVAGGPQREDCFATGDDDRDKDDNDIDPDEDSSMDEMPWDHEQLRRRTDRASNGATGPGRGFIAAANSTKGVVSSAAAESEALAEELKGLHTQSADHVMVSTVHHRLVTSSKDGLLKLWDSDWGNFVGNLLNVGTSWVLHMQFLHNELYLFVATSNAELTVLEFPSGAVLQKYRGCTTLVTALRTVVQPDLGGTKRFGLRPGECGPHRLVYRNGMTAKVFNNRLKESWQVKSETKHNAIPIEGFVSPTAVFLDPTTLICVFGTAEGTVGGFDLSQYLKSSSILALMNLDEPVPFFGKVRAHDSSTPVMGLFYNPVFQYIVSCARDGSVSHIPLNSVLNVESAPNFSRIFQRQTDTPSSQYFFGNTTSSITSNRHVQLVAFCLSARLVATVHSDRRVLLWSMGRNTVDLVHRFSQETYDIVSVSFMPKDHLIAVLTADLIISVYDFKGFRPLSMIHVTKCDGCNVEDVSWMAMRCPQDDPDGCVAFFPGGKGRLVCALRGPILFDRFENGPHEESSAETKAKVLPTSPEPEEPEPKLGTTAFELQQPSTALPTSPLNQQKANTQQKTRKNVTHHGAIVDVLLRHVRQGSSATDAEGVNEKGVGTDRFELHTFSADWWRVWDPLKGDLLREVNLCAEIRKQLPMFHRPLVTVCDWSTDACTRIIAGSRGGQVITLDASTGAVNNVEEVLVVQRPLSNNKRFVDRFHETQTNRRVHNKRASKSGPTSVYKSPASETLDAEKQTSSPQPILDPGSLFNLDATVVYHYGMHMLVCGSNRCVLRRYFTNDVDPSGEEQFIAMNFHLPATARTTITACCIVRDTHICLGTMDTRLFFYRMVDGSEPYAEEPLRSCIGVGDKTEESEPEIGAVIGLFFLNSSNQNLFVIVLDTGVVHVYSYLTNRSVARFRLHRAHECRIRKVIYHNTDVQLLICGDSLGRVRVLDISAFKSDTVDFAAVIKERCVFQGAPEEVSSLAYFSLPTVLPSAKFQDLPSRHRSILGVMSRYGMAQRRSTTGSGMTARSAKGGEQPDSESSQVLSAAAVTDRTGSSINSAHGKHLLVDSRSPGGGNQEDFVVVGSGDGNVRLFSLQRQYERARPQRRSSHRIMTPFETGHIGTRRLSFARPSFAINSSIESSATLAPPGMQPNISPIRDHESLTSRRHYHSVLNLSHVGVFGLNKWNAMNSDTFQRKFSSSRTVEGATILVSSRCSRSSSMIAPEGQDEGFLDYLLLQAKRNVELSSHAASQALQGGSSIEDRTAGLHLASKRKMFDHAKRVGSVKWMNMKPTAYRKSRMKEGKNLVAASRTLQKARQEQQQHPRDFRRRVVSQRELKLLQTILPRKCVAMGFLASVNADDLPPEVFHPNDKPPRRPQTWNGRAADRFLYILRPQRGLRGKYERNALLKMYPVSWLRKIEVIPNTCKIEDYHEDGSPRLIPTESAFGGHWDLSAFAYYEGSSNEIDTSGSPMNSGKIFAKDVFSESIKMASTGTTQDSDVGVVSIVECPSLTDAMRAEDNHGSSSPVQKKNVECGDGAQSSFITDLENIAVSKTLKLPNDSSHTPIMGLPTLGPTSTLTVLEAEGHPADSQLNKCDALPSLIATQLLTPTPPLQDSEEARVPPSEPDSSTSTSPNPTDTDASSGKVLQHRGQSVTGRHPPDKRLSSMNRPVFIGDGALAISENLTTSVSSLMETVPHTPKSFSYNDCGRAPVETRSRDHTHSDNALQSRLQNELSNLSASVVGQRCDQTILAHLAHQLDRVRPSGYAPGAFLSRIKQVWQQRSIEDESETMILMVSNAALHRRRGNPRTATNSLTKERRVSPVAGAKLKGLPKAAAKHQSRSGMSCVSNHAMVQQDPGIGLNLALLTLPTEKKNSIVSEGVRHGEVSSVSAATKDTSNLDKTSTLPAHERLYRRLESWRRHREQEVVERRRVVERLTGRAADNKASKLFSLMPNRLVRLPLLYAAQALEPVHVPAPPDVPRYSEDARDH
ncbi:unnamed protein product [Phytomonas sp. EM1]|nr:unnamed protein product [Phytomonas sp. EM1]|eukprot:CCW62582.1 unnamed protein product [Phytomonas sp. isolate EM1]